MSDLFGNHIVGFPTRWLNCFSASERHHRSSVPRKIEFRSKKQQARQDCFSAPVDSFLDEFDFEKNLALFDKKAVFEEIESAQPEVVKACEKTVSKYRCDENVLQTAPVVLQQIKVPNQSGHSYVTGNKVYEPHREKTRFLPM